MDTKRIYFLRHGQTVQSRENHFCGSGLNPELTPEGLAMANCFATAYKDMNWSAIYSSPLQRTMQTAQCILNQCILNNSLRKKHELTIEQRDGLKEISYGLWEGKDTEEVNKQFHDDYIRWTADPAWCPPTEGETATAIAQRSALVINEILQRFATGNILIVSHKATIRIMLCTLLGIDVGRFRFRLDCPVCSLSMVEFTKQGPWMRIMADRSHVSAELKELPGT